jgi:NhaP-type Na+/H+ or K+/H+ antiporter
MEKRFAGILGSLAFAIVAAQSAWYGADLYDASRIAIFSMAGFAAFGYIVGIIARLIVQEARRSEAEVQPADEGRKTR